VIVDQEDDRPGGAVIHAGRPRSRPPRRPGDRR
jgi:hypothetical protein